MLSRRSRWRYSRPMTSPNPCGARPTVRQPPHRRSLRGRSGCRAEPLKRWPKSGPRQSDDFADKIAEWVDHSNGRERPDLDDAEAPALRSTNVMLRCTKKLLDVICPEQLADAGARGSDWSGNLLVLDRRKCLLLTHADSLFTIFEPDVRAPDLRLDAQTSWGLADRDGSSSAEGLPVPHLRRSRNRGTFDRQDCGSQRARLHERHGLPLRRRSRSCRKPGHHGRAIA